MSSEGDITNYYVSGWCGTCGRKRGADGRCSNCDAWWTSPLVQIGGPAVAITILLLSGIVSLVKSKSAPAELVMQPAPRLVAQANSSFSPGSPYSPPSQPVLYPSAVPAPAPFYSQGSTSVTPLPTSAAVLEAQRVAEFGRLRQMAYAAEAALRADDMAREARERTFSRAQSAPVPQYSTPSLRPSARAVAAPAMAAPAMADTVEPTAEQQ